MAEHLIATSLSLEAIPVDGFEPLASDKLTSTSVSPPMAALSWMVHHCPVLLDDS